MNVVARSLFLALACTACASLDEPRSEDPRGLVARFVAAANARDEARLRELLAPEFRRHSQATPGVEVRSAEDMLRFLRDDAAAFPDGRVDIAATLLEGDRVAFRGTYAGTQRGPLGPYPATGRALEIDVAGEFRVADGRIAELWILWDNLAVLARLGHWPPPDAAAAEAPPDANAALARVWFEQVINRRDLDAVARHYAPDYVHHGPAGAELRGLEAARGFAAAILAASSDRVAVVEQQIAEGDLVVTRFTSHGTFDGPFQGREPTGGEWVTEGICISRIENGRIAEDWEIVQSTGL